MRIMVFVVIFTTQTCSAWMRDRLVGSRTGEHMESSKHGKRSGTFKYLWARTFTIPAVLCGYGSGTSWVLNCYLLRESLIDFRFNAYTCYERDGVFFVSVGSLKNCTNNVTNLISVIRKCPTWAIYFSYLIMHRSIKIWKNERMIWKKKNWKKAWM